MNTKILSIILGLAVLGSLGSFYLSRPHKSQTHKFTIRDVELYSHVDPDELHYRVSLFNDWAEQNDKRYGAEEAHIRFREWNKNYEIVQEHNAKNLSWTLGMNLFADLSVEEFSALHLGYRADLYNETLEADNVEAFDESKFDESLLADSVDWRDKKAVTVIKNQGSCGGCYAFASASALEGLRVIKGDGKLQALSPQQIIDCSTGQGNQGCNGGLMTYSFTYTKSNGLSTNTTYRFKGSKGTCSSTKVKESVFKNTGYKSVTSGSGTALKTAVAAQPVAVAVEADKSVFQLYSSGTITGSSCGTSLDHAITAVGYSGTSYWIVKNSWGPTWGLNGYVRIGYTASGDGVCGINKQASYPTL